MHDEGDSLIFCEQGHKVMITVTSCVDSGESWTISVTFSWFSTDSHKLVSQVWHSKLTEIMIWMKDLLQAMGSSICKMINQRVWTVTKMLNELEILGDLFQWHVDCKNLWEKTVRNQYFESRKAKVCAKITPINTWVASLSSGGRLYIMRWWSSMLWLVAKNFNSIIASFDSSGHLQSFGYF